LAEYRQELATRPEIVVVTKAELPEAAEVHARLSAELSQPVHLISAITGQGLRELLEAVTGHLDQDRLLAASRAAAARGEPPEADETVRTATPHRLPPHKTGPMAERDPRTSDAQGGDESDEAN
jgi:GTP-binding protein